jgi:hypothetical protein
MGEDHWIERLAERRSPKWDSFSWVTVKALFESVNDVFAKAHPEIVDERRLRWIAGLRSSAPEGLGDHIVDAGRDDGKLPAFFIIGDTGEQDASQYAAIPLLEGRPDGDGPTYRAPDDTPAPPDFMFILSDVIYPAGNVNEYFNGFYLPYRAVGMPIYAIPGNHDWYDGLNGFMFNFCGAEPLPAERFRQTEVAIGTRLSNWLWRGSEEPHRAELATLRDSRTEGRNANGAVQPAPYFAIDLGDVLLVAVDTGVTGPIDDEQGRWLLRVSQRPQQKVFLTGKPVCVDNDHHPGEIHWKPDAAGNIPAYPSVDDIVRDPAFGYIASIGGDVHNYQRYPMTVPGLDGERTMPYIVSGGGGAYLSPTHRIPPVGEPVDAEHSPWPPDMKPPAGDMDVPRGAPEEAQFKCYPDRAESLSFTAKGAGPRLFNGVLTLSSFLVLALILALSDVAPRGSVPRHGISAVYVSPLALALPFALLALAYVMVKRLLVGRGEPHARCDDALGERLKKAVPLGKTMIIGCGVVAVLAAAAWFTEWPSDEELLTNGRFWATWGLALGVPLVLLIGIVAAHDLRHAVPGSMPSVLTAASYAAFLPIFVDIEPSGAPRWLATAVVVSVLLAAITAALVAVRTAFMFEDAGPAPPRPRRPRRRLGFWYFALRAAFFLGPALLTLAVINESDADWVWRAAIGALGAGILPILLAKVFGTLPKPPLVDPASAPWRLSQTVTNYAIGVAWAAAYVAVLSLAGDGWLATSAVGAPVFLLIMVGTVAFAFMWLAHWNWASFAVVVMTVIALIVGATQDWDLPWPTFAAGGLVILVLAWLSVHRLRRGTLSVEHARTYIRGTLSEGSSTELVSGDEKALIKALYRRPRGIGAGSAPSANGAAEAFARLAAQLGDSDRPGFYKHLLRCDVSPATGPAGEDRRLTIRVFAYNGCESVTDPDPKVVDKVEVAFFSAAKWKQRATGSMGEPTPAVYPLPADLDPSDCPPR